MNGVQINKNMRTQESTISNDNQITGSVLANVGPGQVKVDVYWSISGGTLTSPADLREMVVKELAA